MKKITDCLKYEPGLLKIKDTEIKIPDGVSVHIGGLGGDNSDLTLILQDPSSCSRRDLDKFFNEIHDAVPAGLRVRPDDRAAPAFMPDPTIDRAHVIVTHRVEGWDLEWHCAAPGEETRTHSGMRFEPAEFNKLRQVCSMLHMAGVKIVYDEGSRLWAE